MMLPKPTKTKKPKKDNTIMKEIHNEGTIAICPICCKCKEGFDIHHLIKKSQGGTNTIDNLVVLCSECHHLAHDEPRRFRELFGCIKYNFLMKGG